MSGSCTGTGFGCGPWESRQRKEVTVVKIKKVEIKTTVTGICKYLQGIDIAGRRNPPK